MDAFFTSTLTVTLAEMGDKTQLLSLLLVTRLQKPWQIIAGILIATLLNHGVSAWFGDWLSQFLTSELGELLIHLTLGTDGRIISIICPQSETIMITKHFCYSFYDLYMHHLADQAIQADCHKNQSG